MAAEKLDHADILVYLTQDAVIANSRLFNSCWPHLTIPLVGRSIRSPTSTVWSGSYRDPRAQFQLPQPSEVVLSQVAI